MQATLKSIFYVLQNTDKENIALPVGIFLVHMIPFSHLCAYWISCSTIWHMSNLKTFNVNVNKAKDQQVRNFEANNLQGHVKEYEDQTHYENQNICFGL